MNSYVHQPANSSANAASVTYIRFVKRHYVDVHRQSKQHQKSTCSSSSTSRQTFLPPPLSTTFTDQIVKMFLAAEIPLHKLRNSEMIKLFYSIGNPLPSGTTCRRRINDLADEELECIKSLLTGDVFMRNLIGSVDHPQVAYLISETQIADSPTATTIIHAIDDTMRKLATERHNFLLLLSDAASYMIAAGKGLNPLYPNLFHVTCVAHLLHALLLSDSVSDKLLLFAAV